MKGKSKRRRKNESKSKRMIMSKGITSATPVDESGVVSYEL